MTPSDRAAARAGAAAEVEPLVDELRRLSSEFAAMWRDNDVRSHHEGVKHIRHPALGPLAFEYSAFAVDGRPDLSMVVYNPATPADANKISTLLKSEGRKTAGINSAGKASSGRRPHLSDAG